MIPPVVYKWGLQHLQLITRTACVFFLMMSKYYIIRFKSWTQCVEWIRFKEGRGFFFQSSMLCLHNLKLKKQCTMGAIVVKTFRSSRQHNIQSQIAWFVLTFSFSLNHQKGAGRKIPAFAQRDCHFTRSLSLICSGTKLGPLGITEIKLTGKFIR